MPGFKRHIFVCTNRRDDADPKGCCAAKGSDEIRSRLKSSLKARGLNRLVRANSAGCLDACAQGATVVVYPEGVWYSGVTPNDVEEILERHVIGGQVVGRLLMPGSAAPANLEPLLAPGAPEAGTEGKP